MSTNSTFDSKPVRALAGAAEAAATTLREFSGRIADTVSDERFRADARERISGLSTRVSAAATDENAREDIRRQLRDLPVGNRTLGEAPGFVRELPARVSALPARTREAFSWERRHEVMSEFPARARDAATQAVHQATKVYDDFADRGEEVVARWRVGYGGAFEDVVATIRGRAADAADDAADAVGQVAGNLEKSKAKDVDKEPAEDVDKGSGDATGKVAGDRVE